ncbi:unnamed protein product, partial [Prorocentrum cordatum]
ASGAVENRQAQSSPRPTASETAVALPVGLEAASGPKAADARRRVAGWQARSAEASSSGITSESEAASAAKRQRMLSRRARRRHQADVRTIGVYVIIDRCPESSAATARVRAQCYRVLALAKERAGHRMMAVFLTLSVSTCPRPSFLSRLRPGDIVKPRGGGRCWGLLMRPQEWATPDQVGESGLSLELDSARHSGASVYRARGERSQAEVQRRGGWLQWKNMARYKMSARLGQQTQIHGLTLLACGEQRLRQRRSALAMRGKALVIGDQVSAVGSELASHGTPTWTWRADALGDQNLGAPLEQRVLGHLKRKEALLLFVSPVLPGASRASDNGCNRYRVKRFAERLSRLARMCWRARVPFVFEMPGG